MLAYKVMYHQTVVQSQSPKYFWKEILFEIKIWKEK